MKQTISPAGYSSYGDLMKIYIAGYGPNGDEKLPKSIIGSPVFTVKKEGFCWLGEVQGITKDRRKFRVNGNGRKGFFDIAILGDGQKIYNDSKR